MVYVYGLVDPRTHRVRYVGQTVDLHSRLTNHEANGATAVKGWIDGLRAEGHRALMVILDVVEGDAASSEARWIDHFDRLGALLNSRGPGWDRRPKARTPKPLSRGAEMLRVARAERRLSQGSAATLLGIDRSVISRLESGCQGPGRGAAQSMERELGIPIDAWDVVLEAHPSTGTDGA